MKSQLTSEPELTSLLEQSLCALKDGFGKLPAFTPSIQDAGEIQNILSRVTELLKDNYPYFHPLYAGQMLKPPHPMAWLAYALAMWINPNNHALDGGRASSRMEKEAVAEIAQMFGWTEHLGHLTGGGTMANLEALWIAGQVKPGASICASEQARYTHERISKLLRLPFEPIGCDRRGRMDVNQLKRKLNEGNIGTVVATIGTTATGSVDPLPELLELRNKFGFRLHADAAYGGYYVLASNLDEPARRTFDLLNEADSIVIDPHKHGLQPYGCGCVLFKDPAAGQFYKHDSPYTYFSSEELHLGEISLECSRAGAAAVALWATQKLMPLVRNGEMSERLQESRRAALDFYEKLKSDNRFITAFRPELDIVIWIPRRTRVSEASQAAREIFAEAARRDLHLALAQVPVEFFCREGVEMERDQATVTCLRSVLLKPEHAGWIDRIWAILSDATNQGLSEQPGGKT